MKLIRFFKVLSWNVLTKQQSKICICVSYRVTHVRTNWTIIVCCHLNDRQYNCLFHHLNDKIYNCLFHIINKIYNCLLCRSDIKPYDCVTSIRTFSIIPYIITDLMIGILETKTRYTFKKLYFNQWHWFWSIVHSTIPRESNSSKIIFSKKNMILNYGTVFPLEKFKIEMVVSVRWI